MPQCCYLAKGAKRPSHTTNTIKFDRIPFDPCNSIKRFDLCPFDQENSTYLQPSKLEDDLLHWTHDASSSFPDSVANLLESHVTRFGKFLRIHNCTRYKQQDINLFINHLWNLRWKNNDNRSFLKCYTRTPPTCNTISPLFNLQRYEAIKICEMLIGNSSL